MFFRKSKEKQSLIEESRRALAEAEKIIKQLKDELRIAKHNNEVLLQRNHKQSDFIKEIEKLTTMNTYNNEKIFLNKIRELVHDYQSKN